MIRVRTGSRLHFGLIAPPHDGAYWLNHEGHATILRRAFGGVGLMIDRPGIELTIDFANTWAAEGALAERARAFAQLYCSSVGVTECFAIRIESAPAEHAGLGTGTQLGVAVARAIAELTEQPHRNAVALARHVKRGQRSALGVHGFDHGGFLVEGGKSGEDRISPLLVRHEFPEAWKILLITPRDVSAIHGARERQVFAELAKQVPDDAVTETLCRLVLLGMLPSLGARDRDLRRFGEALWDFNCRAGALFKSAQGGIYAHPRIEEIVKGLREYENHTIRGVGQSSWGPTIFAVVAMADEELAYCQNWLTLKHGITKEEMMVTQACNQGAVVSA